VPDVYQGDELWDLSLVDPDNRRPVDHGHRARLLADLRGDVDAGKVMDRLDEGLPKLWLLRQALDLRHRRAAAFGPEATYEPVWAGGERAEHVLAFGRSAEVVAVAPLQVRRLGPSFAAWRWGDTHLELPEGTWHDVLTGATVQGRVLLADLLRTFPVALLERS
jgi:(1->4)-alpha-D-glucan 1-alpha-D-glucosylmutase